jgi:hypothetical protein
MKRGTRFGTARAALALLSVAAFAACSDDSQNPTALQSSKNPGDASPGVVAGASAKQDSSQSNPSGEWHLATIRGVLLGLTVDSMPNSPDAPRINGTPVPNATVEIHKFALPVTSTTGDSTTITSGLKDLGVVATVTADAQGKFQYVLADPLIVKTGQPSPKITYQLTVTPPSGSPFAARSGIQVYFMEQLPPTLTEFAYYVNKSNH